MSENIHIVSMLHQDKGGIGKKSLHFQMSKLETTKIIREVPLIAGFYYKGGGHSGPGCGRINLSK